MKTAETDGTIIEFLLGSHPYDGVWFGDQHPEKEGWFWWRKALRDYASHPSPMSAEQVEVLHAIMVLAEHGIPGYAFGDNEAACEMDNRLSEICRLASTTPSVKADGWVSVDKEKEFHKVLKCLKNNKVMVGTREDGIYIRLAGRESEGEAFTLHFALAYPFPKLPPHQNNNK